MGHHGKRTKLDMNYILKSFALCTAMERATSEEEFQRLLAADDALNDAHAKPRFRPRTLADMKRPFHGGAHSTHGPKLPKGD
jgi:hypothetical protein